MGVYGTSTFFQGQPATPAAHPVPASSSCTTSSTIANGFLISGTAIAPPGATSSGASSAALCGYPCCFTDGSERLIPHRWSAVIGSMFGALFVL
ncbi:hypothetical protein BDZ97DRAFT_1884528 [Flammula alnicola]|nr:hypothetical protein BDZ97DRAFT_1884528 [Flammula alnicola]